MSLLNKIIKGLLIVILISAIISVIYLVVIHNPGESYTEFYLLDSNLETRNYPTNVSQYSIEKIFIGIKNKENTEMNYTVRIVKDNRELSKYNKTLQHNEKTETAYYIDSTSIKGNNQLIIMELYKGNISAPYRTLKLRYNVI